MFLLDNALEIFIVCVKFFFKDYFININFIKFITGIYRNQTVKVTVGLLLKNYKQTVTLLIKRNG